jgi:leucyl-tRNA synthetase
MNERYEPAAIEQRWQERWEREGRFRADSHGDRPKTYILEMFPYPSGWIHMGHVRCYVIGDVIARYHRTQGADVLHPMGWDAFGMPAENAAIQRGTHPSTWTKDNIATMRAQLRRMGLSYDWEREFATCDPEYYRWEQQVFLEMLERGLAYKKHAPANWCPSCQTVLANEQVEGGGCWRCGEKVEIRALEQWFLRITDYAEELLAGCDRLSGWPERVLAMQRNWIGKSVGAEVCFELVHPDLAGARQLTVFTTRPDTLCGATFLSLAVEHPLVLEIARASGREREVSEFVAQVKAQSPEERADGKEGIFTGGFCRNPMTGAEMPIHAANFVLMEYGTGAVMAVPTHDQRDFEFARRYELPMIVVIQPEDQPPLDPATMEEAWEGPGRMVRSAEFDGLSSQEGKARVADSLKERGLGGPTVQFRLRDWCISRQRYWGTPIPVIYCDDCGIVPVPVADLPVELPLDVPFTGEGGSPLTKTEAFSVVECPKCTKPGRRETDTMDTFVESSWYFARFTCPDETTRPLDRSEANRWLPVEQYIGGIEHAVLHLIYARFFTKVLRDLGHLDVDEPFKNLLTQGMVCKETLQCPEHGWLYPQDAPEGTCKSCGKPVVVGRVEKMSKSKRNVIDPDDLIQRYGADTVRLFCLFAAPPERDLEWSDRGVEGAHRFLNRLWRLVHGNLEVIRGGGELPPLERLADDDLQLWREVNRAVHRATGDVGERFQFNTAIAATMELVNAMVRFQDVGDLSTAPGAAVFRGAVRAVIRLLAPMVPHITAELWELLGSETALDDEPWPEVDERALVEETATIVVQVNGKLRGRLIVERGTSEETVVEQARADPGVVRHLEGKTLRKWIFVPDKLLNLVVG